MSSTPVPTPAEIETAILHLTHLRGTGKSICPSEAARLLRPGPPADGWQGLLPTVRQAAVRLALAGQIDILRKGQPVDPATVKGVIRLRQASLVQGVVK